MSSDRRRLRIERLLDEAEEAVSRYDWEAVREAAQAVLAFDPDNGDAIDLLGGAERAIGVSAPTPAGPRANSVPPSVTSPRSDQPRSFSDGRYQVKQFLGEGGKKRVYHAHDSTLDRDVAIAVIKTEGLDDVARSRITREAQSMGRLGDHPNILQIHDLGEESAAISGQVHGQPYLIMPLMTGGSVDNLIQNAPDDRIEPEQALDIGKGVCRGLEFAHVRVIVHRDLKPGNVWLADDGTAKIGDFGLAVVLDRSRITGEGTMVGTVSYMPPEQAMGGEVPPQSDLYSLGAMLYEMVSGRPPFLGDDAVAIIGQHVNTSPVAPTWHNGHCPRALDALILRLLAKDPSERAQSASDVLAALDAIDLSEAPPLVKGDGGISEAHALNSLAGGVFVGRQQEMGELKAALEDALSGHGRLVMLVGEPGIGKTRTAQELATYAGMRGTQVIWGRCYEEQGMPPYWPWVQSIRSYVRDHDPERLRSEMGAGAADIAGVVSDVRERLPDLPTSPELDPEQARFRLFDSITNFLKSAGQSQPLVLMLDDLHWADKPSFVGTDKLVRYSLLAEERALASFAYEDAANHFERGLIARDIALNGTEAASDEEAAALLFGLGRADSATVEGHQIVGVFAILSRVFKYYAEAGNVDLAVAAAEFPITSPTYHIPGLAELIAHPLNLVPTDSHQAGHLLSRYGGVLGASECNYEGAQDALERAMSIARRDGDVPLEVQTLTNAALVSGQHLHWQESVDTGLRAIELATVDENPFNDLISLFWTAVGPLFMGDLDRARPHVLVMRNLAEKRSTRRMLAGNHLMVVTTMSCLEGDWETGRGSSDRGLEMTPLSPQLLETRAILEHETGEAVQGDEYLERLIQRVGHEGDQRAHGRASTAIAAISRITGVPDRLGLAEAAAESVLSAQTVNPIYALCAKAGLALIAVQKGDRSASAEHYIYLLEQRGTMIWSLASVDRILGLLSQTMAELDQSAEHFEDGLAFCRKAGYRPELAWTCCDYSDALRERDSEGDTAKAIALLDKSLAISSELGMRPLMERVLARKLQIQGVASVDIRTSIDHVAAAVQTEQPDLRSHAAPDGTVTILFSDIEGSTQMTERLGDQRMQQVLSGHNEIVRHHVAAYGGFEVKSMGDGFMLAFSSARRALQCAMAIQRAFLAHNQEHPEEPVRVRMGLHTGEFVQEMDDFFGKNVILASRIADQAHGGEILVSSLLKELTVSAGDIQFGEGQEMELKGLAGINLVYSVDWS